MNDLRQAAEMVLETLEGLVSANWRDWEELASPEEFERWVKSRANHSAECIRQALERKDSQEHDLADHKKIIVSRQLAMNPPALVSYITARLWHSLPKHQGETEMVEINIQNWRDFHQSEEGKQS